MSQYYDLSKPYFIDADGWNELLEDVNEILENPDPGCEPIEPIELVTDPHLWSVEDVEEVRNKLIETCPDISFVEDLVIWHPEIIDEIEAEMEKAWCDCEPIDYEETIDLGNPCFAILNASHYGNPTATPACDGAVQCCGNTVFCAPCYACPGQFCWERVYYGDFYPCYDYNAKANACIQMSTLHTEISTEFYTWWQAWIKCKTAADQIEYWQGLLDTTCSQLDALIAQYNSLGCPGSGHPSCSSICYQINSKHSLAVTQQNQVNSWVNTKFIPEEAKIDPASNNMDSKATQNWTLGMTTATPYRFPTGKSWITELNSAIAGRADDFAWGKWFLPATHTKPTDYYTWIFDNCPLVSSPNTDGHVLGRFYKTDSRYGVRSGMGPVRFTPNGKPYIHGNFAAYLGRDYAYTYYDLDVRWRCEHPFGCGDHGTCEWPPDYEPTSRVWWSQSCCGGFCGWVWAPLPEPTDFYCEHFEFDICYPGRRRTDQTEKQQEWRAKYVNWFDEHPQYDNRGAGVC